MKKENRAGPGLLFLFSLILAFSCAKDHKDRVREARSNYDVRIVSSAPNYEAKVLLIETSVKNDNRKGKGLAVLTTLVTLYDEKGEAFRSDRVPLDVGRIGPYRSATVLIKVPLPETEVHGVTVEIEKNLSDGEIELLKESSRSADS